AGRAENPPHRPDRAPLRRYRYRLRAAHRRAHEDPNPQKGHPSMTSNVTPLRPRRDPPAGNPNTHQAADTEPAPVGRLVYTVKETAHLLSLSLSTTYRLLRSGVIPATKSGGQWAVPKRRLHERVDSLPTVEPTEPVTERERQELAAMRRDTATQDLA